jgi:hypothetical protein
VRDVGERCNHAVGRRYSERIRKSMEFKDLTDEKYRVYEFPNGKNVLITDPQKLNVSKSGGHRVLDGEGVSHYIPAGWFHLFWVVKEGKEPFSF